MLLAFAADVEAAGERPQDSPKAHRQQRFLHCGSGRHGRAGVAGSRQRGARSRRAAAVVRSGHAGLRSRCHTTQGFRPMIFCNQNPASVLINTLPPNSSARPPNATPTRPKSPRTTKQLSSRHDAAQYHEPRIGDSAHVQCRTSLCSLLASLRLRPTRRARQAERMRARSRCNISIPTITMTPPLVPVPNPGGCRACTAGAAPEGSLGARPWCCSRHRTVQPAGAG